jgi:hypothetical protein
MNRELLTFSDALILLKLGGKVSRQAWPSTYYMYIDTRFPDKFVLIYDRTHLTDQDILGEDWYERLA